MWNLNFSLSLSLSSIFTQQPESLTRKEKETILDVCNVSVCVCVCVNCECVNYDIIS